MNDIFLIYGEIVACSIDQSNSQDYIEVKLQDGQVVIITASTCGRLRIGMKLEDI